MFFSNYVGELAVDICYNLSDGFKEEKLALIDKITACSKNLRDKVNLENAKIKRSFIENKEKGKLSFIDFIISIGESKGKQIN